METGGGQGSGGSSHGYRVCVVDAAVLVMAGWHRRVHQLVRRVMERNSLPEEEATQRLAAQPENKMYVDHAHIVIGTQWDPEVTRGQVEKAWQQVLNRIDQKN
ncbi:Bifunctional coenzyme A synthase [Geodia barretti]|uniref:Bifunctional coenzyme A synthase n=1 Tax=Geodia barretti TaxID=519541 RepID=A0AA35U1F6_GEOBA|nr:Bifunctional coenzyme A synthase [Geodia barretti]